MTTTLDDPRDEVRVVRTPDELEELRPFWSAQPTHRDAGLDFYRLMLEALPGVERPHVVVLHRDGRPKAMLVGRLERRRLELRLGYLTLARPRLRTLTFVHGGVIGDVSAGDAARLVRSVTESLGAGEADAAVFEGVVLESPLHAAARSEPSRLAADFALVPLVHRMRRVATGTGQFLAGLSANERSNQRRRLRRLRDDFAGAVRFERFAAEAEVARMMDEAEAVAKTSYQRGLGVGFVHSPAMRRRLELEARQGTLRGYVLHVGDRPCAAWITSYRQGVLYNDFLAYDPHFAKYAPGTCLVMHVIEDIAGSADGGDHITVDFGPGEMEWKARLGNLSRQEATVHVFAPTLKGVAMNLARAGCVSAARAAKATLEHYGVLARVKRAWRARAAARP